MRPRDHVPNPKGSTQALPPVIIGKKEAKAIQATLDTAIVKYLEKLPVRIPRMLDKVVTAYLGFSTDGFNRIKIHDGSYISKLIDNRAEKIVQNLVGALQWRPTENELQTLEKAARDKYAASIKRRLDDCVYKAATARVEQAMEDLFTIDVVLDEMKAPTLEEMADPEYGQTPLEELILAIEVEETLEKESLELEG